MILSQTKAMSAYRAGRSHRRQREVFTWLTKLESTKLLAIDGARQRTYNFLTR